MKFFNSREKSFAFRLSGCVDLVVKPQELSPSIDYFDLNKSKLKYLFSSFPIYFESTSEKNKFDKKRIPYVLYTPEIEDKVVLTQESPVLQGNLKTKDSERFIETKIENVDEVKMIEPESGDKKWATTESVSKSILETKEVETIQPVKAMEDHHEDVLSGSLERILNIAEAPKKEEKKGEYSPFADLTSDEMTTFTNGKHQKSKYSSIKEKQKE